MKKSTLLTLYYTIIIVWIYVLIKKQQYLDHLFRGVKYNIFQIILEAKCLGWREQGERDRYLELLTICRITVAIVHHQSFSDQLNKDQKLPWQPTFLEKTARKEEEMYSSSIKYTTTYPFHMFCIQIQTALDKVSQVKILFKTFPFDWLPRPECSAKLKTRPFKSSQISQHVIFLLVHW